MKGSGMYLSGQRRSQAFGEFASIPGFRLVSEVKTPNISSKKPHQTLFFPIMQRCTVQSREEDSGAAASGWGLLMPRRVVDIDLTGAPEKREFLFFRVYTDAAVSCHVSASGSLNVTGSGERRCLPRASLERNLTGKSHKTSFKEQAEIACLSSSASLSHRHPPPHPPTPILSHLEPSPA